MCYTLDVASNALRPRQLVDQLQTELAALSSAKRSSVLLSLAWFQRPQPMQRPKPETPRWAARRQGPPKANGSTPSSSGWWTYKPAAEGDRQKARQATQQPPQPSNGCQPGYPPHRRTQRGPDGIQRYDCPQPKRPTYQPPPPPPAPILSYVVPANDGPTAAATTKAQWRPQSSDPSVWRLTPPKFLHDFGPSPLGKGLPRII